MVRETYQEGSSVKGPTGKVDLGNPGSRTGGKRFPGNKKISRNNPGKTRNKFAGRSSELSGYVFDTTQ